MIEVIGEDHAFFCGKFPKRKPCLRFGDGGRQADGQLKLGGKFQIHIKKLWSHRNRSEVRRKVRYVNAPFDSARNLCAAFAQHFGRVCVFPQVVHRARETAFAGLQAWRIRQRAPSVHLVFAIDGEVHANVFAVVIEHRMFCPRRRHHQRGTCCNTFTQRVVHAHVGGMKCAKVVATKNDQFRIGCVSQSFCKCWRAHFLNATSDRPSIAPVCLFVLAQPPSRNPSDA